MLLIGEVLRRQATPSAHGSKVALREGERGVTYAQLDARANELARALLRLGIGPGERVALLDRNGIDWVAVYFAAARASAVLVPLSFWHRPGELRYAIEQSGAAAVIASADYQGTLDSTRGECAGVRHWLSLGPSGAGGWRPIDDLAESEDSRPLDSQPDERDPHIILYTSGTTGFPKGAVLSHRAHVLHALTFALYTGAQADDVYLNVYPLFHTGGTDCAVLPYLSVGATVILSRHPTARSIAEHIQEHRVTAMMAVPTLWRQLLDLPDLQRFDLSSLQRAMGSSDAMPRELLEALLRRLPVTWTQTYGLTEAGCILTYLSPRDQFRKIGSVGKPHGQAELIVADEAGHALPAGEIGEVLAKTEHAMSGYWDMPDATEAALRDGWLHTGDLGRLDDEGYLYITGRLKDMIVSGGEKIYPAEVEAILVTHPSVAEVAVVGVPDRTWGEAVLAVIVPRTGQAPDQASVQAFLRERLAGYKVARFVELVDALPKTAATGKVQKAELRRRYAHLGRVP